MEQNCLYQDIDGKDMHGIHYFIKDDKKIISYLRLIDPGIRYPEYALSRIVSDPKYRSFGYATLLIKKALSDIKGESVRISGQAYLKEYYESLGFKVVHGPYLEDDIPHYEMFHPNV